MPRRPVKYDPPHIVAKRLRFARRVRSVLYGADPAPCWGDKKDGHYRREMTWAWTVREYAGSRLFRYIEALDEAKAMVRERGSPWVPTGLAEDLALLKAWQGRMRARAFAEGRHAIAHEQRRDKARVVAETIALKAKGDLIAGVCPLCGDPLPCIDCGVPAVRLDGKGGLEALPMPEGLETS